MNILHRLYILLPIFVTTALSVGTNEFSTKLRDVVDPLLGTKEFQRYVDGLNFRKTMPDGRAFTQMFADDLNEKVKQRADVVHELRTTIEEAFSNNYQPSSPILNCCPEKPLNLTDDPRYPSPTNHEIICHYGKEPSPSEPVTGISDRLLDVMRRHASNIPSLKWQYFGNEHGTLYTYPAVGACSVNKTYDPRFRPWYGSAVTYPKDLVIMIEKSHSMTDHFGTETRIHYAIKAAQSVIDTLNPYDHIGVMAFADDVDFPADRCYSRGLSLATPTNKNFTKRFFTGIRPSTEPRANYSNALGEAFRLLTDADSDNGSEWRNNQREKVIMLLSAGSSSDTLSAISRTIADGRRLAGKVKILTFGVNTHESASVTLLKNISDGLYTSLNESDEQAIRRKIGVYYNFFTKPTTDDVVFSVPYIGSQGLGMIISECLPVFTYGKFRGVTCADLKVDTFFSEIIDFRLEQLSYAFFVDSRGRILIHPLLPRPERYPEEPIFLGLESVEMSSKISSIKWNMLSGMTGSESIADLRISIRRGFSQLEGVTSELGSVKYFWSPIELMNASVVVVIVGDEQNDTLSWTTDFPPVLLTDDVSAGDVQTNHKCNNFGRIAFSDRTAVMISLRSFQDSYYYTRGRLPTLKLYLQGESRQQGQLAVKPGVRESIAMTYKLEEIWKRSTAAARNRSVDVDPLDNYALYRYVGTREGVYRVYPAVRVPTKFDPIKQPWYKRAENQRDLRVVYTHTDDSGYVVSSFSKAFVSESVTLGVVGVDVPYSSLYNFLTTQFELCRLSSSDCFAIDRSGFVVIHKDYLTSDRDRTFPVHITTIEQEIAADMVSQNVLIGDTCVRYRGIVTNQLFWKVVLRERVQRLTNSDIHAVEGFDLYVVVKGHALSPGGACICPATVGLTNVPKCESAQRCQCPCYTSTDYNICSGNFSVTNSTKACYPEIALPVGTDSTTEERPVSPSLPSCAPCSLFNFRSMCELNGCCWTSDNLCTATGCSASAGGPSSTSCDSQCLGLAIGLVLAFVVIIAIVVVVVVVLKKRRNRPRRPPGGPHVSNIMVTPATSRNGTLQYDYINPVVDWGPSEADDQNDIHSQYITVPSPTKATNDENQM